MQTFQGREAIERTCFFVVWSQSQHGATWKPTRSRLQHKTSKQHASGPNTQHFTSAAQLPAVPAELACTCMCTTVLPGSAPTGGTTRTCHAAHESNVTQVTCAGNPTAADARVAQNNTLCSAMTVCQQRHGQRPDHFITASARQNVRCKLLTRTNFFLVF